ncbi:hypothetical protein Sango_2077900 [Sesamum angolense]|uniref:Retrotransposon gag domain-containing protein n=1 Tax=Sesamum angolense TaxID=2727404 RepID=A0AAE1WB95_9LAMI|nr:hypothetical protein Sango_2077900 [Sesamum angolense]
MEKLTDLKKQLGNLEFDREIEKIACEDPHKHLKEFHVVCSGMRPQGVSEEQVKLRAFPFFLGDKAKDWLYSLLSGSIVSWNELKKIFLENYFTASQTTDIRKEISGIRQCSGENFYEYWGRFKQLVESCPHHQILDHLLIQYFYEGLSEANRSLVDAASVGHSTSIQNLENQTRASIQNLESQVNQLASSVSLLESQGVGTHNRVKQRIQERGHAEQGKTREELEIPPKQAENRPTRSILRSR